ncbi:cyclic lactone autoinducer peptide [Clostridium sp. FP2]|nr:cyclic lactone autoinducer peptide [Clostridium sp. FP2]MBZ9621688.1 cyclic lactone autoinducer peptide [Clostridium sp. FP2]
MKVLNSKKYLAFIISCCALFIAATSSSLCSLWGLGEPKMPKSLYKKD